MDMFEFDFSKAESEERSEVKKVFEKYGKTIYLHILDRSGSRETAKQLTVQVFAELYEKMRYRCTSDSLEVLLVSIADSKLRNFVCAEKDMGDVKVQFANHDDLKQAIADMDKPAEKQPEAQKITAYDYPVKSRKYGLDAGWIVVLVIAGFVGCLFAASFWHEFGAYEFFKNSLSDLGRHILNMFSALPR